MPTDQLTDAQIADKLAKVAGWGTDGSFWYSPTNDPQRAHPFPVGLVDPLLRHIREVLEPKGWRLDYIDCGHLPPAIVWCRLLNRDSERNVVGKDNSPWSAIARAILAAHEVEAKNAPNT